MVGVYTEINGVCCIDGVLASGVCGGLAALPVEDELPAPSLYNNKNISAIFCPHKTIYKLDSYHSIGGHKRMSKADH